MSVRQMPDVPASGKPQFAGSGIASGGGGGGDTSNLANKTDISSIILTGTTNSTGGTITAGTWFYLNGELVRSKVDIASGATFTDGTNYEEKTIGSALSELNSNIPLTFTIGESDYGKDLVGYVKNGIGFITGSTKHQPSDVWCKVGTITNPSYWPKISLSCTSRDASGKYMGMARITTSGEILSYHTIGGNQYMHYDFAYPTV